MRDYEVGIRLTADGKDLVGAVKMSKKEMDDLGKTFSEVKSLARELNGQQQTLASTLGSQAALIEKQKIASEGLAESYQKMIDGQAGWLQKGAMALAAWSAIGIEKVKTAWDEFAEWSERQIKIWGIALAAGVSAAVIGAVYAAYKGVSFGVGLLTGESYKSANIDALRAMNSQIKTLQENLPLTATGASALNEALKGLGTSSDAYVSTLGSVKSAVRSNREELDRLGVRYQDENEVLLSTEEILQSAADVLDTYTKGWDRHQAELAIGMGSEKQIQDALKASAEKIQTAKARLIAYNLIIGEGTQEAVKKYDDAMRAFQRESELTSEGFKRAIADNVMPILTDLAEFFRDGFPYAVRAFRYSLATITSLFLGLKTVFFIVNQSILDGLSALSLGIGGMADAAAKALVGDFAGANEALILGFAEATAKLGGIRDKIVVVAQESRSAMALAFGGDTFAAISGTADAVERVGREWADSTKAAGDADAAYRNLVKTLKEKLLSDSEQTAVSRLQLDLDALSEKQLATITEARKAELMGLAQQIDAKKQMLLIDQAALTFAIALIAKQEQTNSVIEAFNQSQSEKIQGIQFETEQIRAEAALVGAGLLLKEDEIRLISQVRMARELATGARESELDLYRQLLALGPETNTGYEAAAEALRKLAAAQQAALSDAVAARESARLTNELNANSIREINQLNDVVVVFNRTQSEKIQGIQFETEQIRAESALVGAGLLLKEDEIRLISQVRFARELATGAREIELNLYRQLLALGPETNAGYEEAAQKLRNLAAAQQAALPDVLAARESARLVSELAKNAADEQRRLSEQINQGLVDSIFRGFESGKGIAQNFWGSMVNMAKTTVLTPVIKFLVSPITGAISAAIGGLGIPGLGNAASSAGGGNMLSSASNLFSAGIFGSSAAYAAAVPGLTSFGAGSQAAMLAAQTGEFGLAGLTATAEAAGASAAATGLMTAIPYIGAAVAVYSLLKATGVLGGGDHSAYGTGYRIAGAVNPNAGIAGSFIGMSASDEAQYQYPLSDQAGLTSYFNTQLATAFDEMQKLSRIIGVDAAALANRSFALDASGPYDMPQTVQIALLQITDQMAEQLVPSIRSLQQANESLTQTFVRLAQAARDAAIPDALGRMGMAMQLKDQWKGIEWSDLNPFPMSSAQKLSALAGEYSGNLAGSRAGDINAYNALSGSAQSYLEQARSEYASSQQYVDIYNAVRTEVGDVIQTTMTDQSNRLADMGLSLHDIVANTTNLDKRIVDALKPAIEAWAAAHIAVQQAAAGQIVAAVQQNTVVTQQTAQDTGLVLASANSAAWIDDVGWGSD